MELIESQRLNATVKFELGELIVLNNALNELCHGIEHQQCLERIGTEADTLKKLLEQINAVTVKVATQK
jgi:predicted SprT family Zn-dependent metalloprotease